jgi:hypothetical protein
MKPVCFGVFIVIFGCLLSLGCGGATGKDIYKDKDKPKPAEKEK